MPNYSAKLYLTDSALPPNEPTFTSLPIFQESLKALK